jgi:hypothetical protein
MRTWRRLLIAASLAGLAMAISKDASIEELKSRLEATNRPDEKVKLGITIAQRQVGNADKLFRENKSAEAQAAVRDAVTYAGEARDNAVATGHHTKDTEIALRKMIHRLTDMKRSLSFDEQTSVQSAIDQMEKMRTDLLNRMFKSTK